MNLFKNMKLFNPFDLGYKESNSDKFSELVCEYQKEMKCLPINAEMYMSVLEQNMFKNLNDSIRIKQRLVEAYGGSRLSWFPSTCFVTDNEVLFVEMYKHLKLDFVADFRSGLFFVDLYAAHETLMTSIEELSTPEENFPGNYISRGLGFYKSSQSNSVFIGEDVSIPHYFLPFKNRIERMK